MAAVGSSNVKTDPPLLSVIKEKKKVYVYLYIYIIHITYALGNKYQFGWSKTRLRGSDISDVKK